MASHMHLLTFHARRPGERAKQPYKVAGLRFNPKFISSISKGLSRGPGVSERLTRTTLALPDTPPPPPPPLFPRLVSRDRRAFSQPPPSPPSLPPPPPPPIASCTSPPSRERRNARRCTGASQAHTTTL